MEIKPPSTDLYTAITRSTSSTAQNNHPSAPPDWKVAQLIQAVITKMTDKQLFLDILGVKAHTAKPELANLKVGDILKLQIEQLRPMPQFRILGLQKNNNLNLVSQALKNVSSENTELTSLLKNISYVANRPALRPSPLTADVNAAVRDIYKQIPSPFNLKTAAQIKNQLENSGQFIESKIKNQLLSVLQNIPAKQSENIQAKLSANLKSVLEPDLAAQLYRLAYIIKTQLTHSQKAAPLQNETAILRNNANHLAQRQNVNRTATEHHASLHNINQREEAMHSFLRQIESGLSHLQQHQLQNLSESQAGRAMWLMEFPIKDGQNIDLFELRIKEEENPQEENEVKKIWNVTLQFDLNGLGKIKAHIKMQNEFISAQFFSEKSEVLSLFQENFDFLRSRLNLNGLNVGKLECARAKLSDNTSSAHSTPMDKRT